MSSETFEKLWVPFSNTTQIIHNTNPGFSVFCRIYPYTLSSVANTNTTTTIAQADPVLAAQTHIVQSLGGPVMNRHAPEVWVVWWGSAWNSTSVTHWYSGDSVNAVSLKNSLTNSFNTICNSDYYLGLWQYGNLGLKKPFIGGHVIHTATALPGATKSIWTPEVENMLKNAMASGQIPNADNFMEPTNIPSAPQPFTWMDFRHIYYVMIPPNKTWVADMDQIALGWAMRGVSANNRTFQYAAGQVWPTNQIDSAEQTFAHELIHNMSHPMFYGAPGWGGYCTPRTDSQEARDDYWYTPLNHDLTPHGANQNCDANSLARNLSGTSVQVELYWSDMDGNCIAPGTGLSWTRPPATPPPLPPPPPSTPPPPGPAPPPPFPPPPPGSGSGLRCIWIKQDDKNNGAQALLGSDGTLYFNVKVNNQRFKIRTNPGVVTSNAWHQIWCTFNKQTNAIDIYVDNIRWSIPSSINELWNDRHSHFIIGNYDTGSALAPFRGRIDDFRLYRNGVVTSQNVANMWENNHTIEAVPTDQGYAVAIAGFVKLDEPLVTNPVDTSVVSPDILTPTPPAPPPPPGDDLPPPPPPTKPAGAEPIVDDFNWTGPASLTDPVPPITAEPIICTKEDIE